MSNLLTAKYPYPILPGGARPGDLHSLNGLGMIVTASGPFVDPLRWKRGIQGLSSTVALDGLMTFPGSGGSDPLVRNPINAGTGMGYLDSVPRLAPGLHGLMTFPGSGGSDALVRNPINPNYTNASVVSSGELGTKNKLADGMRLAPTNQASTPAVTGQFDIITDAATFAHMLGLAGLGCAGDTMAAPAPAGLGCGCGCNGTGGCGTGGDGMSGLGDTTGSSTLQTVCDNPICDIDAWLLGNGIDLSLSGSLIPGISNTLLYGGLGVLIVAGVLLEPKARYTVSRRRNPRRRRRARK
jgi:hypothetical protein